VGKAALNLCAIALF